MMENSSFAGRCAYVTGGGGGIGLQVALDLLAAGATVVAVDAKSAPAELTGADNCTFLQGDVTDPSFTEAALTRATTELSLSFVVNAAGIGGADGAVEDTDPDVWQRVLDVNLTAATHLVRHALPRFGKGGGAFVHIASVAALRVADGPMDAYQVSKAGLCSLSRGVALRQAPNQIRSNTVCPGAILTPMVEPLYREDPARRQRMIDRTPIGRLGTPSDISAAALFLLSDAASFITGVDLVVDGGWTLPLQ